MKIKFSKFKSRIHEAGNLDKSSQSFLNKINKELGNKLIYTDDLSDYDCDLKLIYIESGGSEGYFLKNFKKFKPPYILLTSGENNSLAASLEIMHYLHLKHLKGEILHGDIKYIVNRMKKLCR
ncbi:MAG: hypothetical protein MJ214_03355 [Bacilli bacterium]|nr:hypothetical protein [Bacilli bacterium]